MERLIAALEARGKDVWLDVEDIPGGADWRARIKRGIEACNAFVFVLGPSSLSSDHCGEELAVAAAQNKLIIPLYHQEVDQARLPAVLADPEWIFMRDGDDFESALDKLVDALESDVEWRDQHTRIAGRAREWLDAEHDRSFLLRGSDLRDAESWFAGQADHRESATAAQAEYIVQSRRAATARQRRLTAAVTSGLMITGALAVFALIQRNNALDERDAALSTLYATRALGELSDDPTSSLALALKAYATKKTDLAEGALRVAASEAVPHLILRAGTGPIASVAYAPDRRHLATAGSDGTVRIWDTRTPTAALTVLRGHVGAVFSVAWAPDGRRLASAGADRTIRVWDWSTPSRPPIVLRGHRKFCGRRGVGRGRPASRQRRRGHHGARLGRGRAADAAGRSPRSRRRRHDRRLRARLAPPRELERRLCSRLGPARPEPGAQASGGRLRHRRGRRVLARRAPPGRRQRRRHGASLGLAPATNGIRDIARAHGSRHGRRLRARRPSAGEHQRGRNRARVELACVAARRGRPPRPRGRGHERELGRRRPPGERERRRHRPDLGLARSASGSHGLARGGRGRRHEVRSRPASSRHREQGQGADLGLARPEDRADDPAGAEGPGGGVGTRRAPPGQHRCGRQARRLGLARRASGAQRRDRLRALRSPRTGSTSPASAPTRASASGTGARQAPHQWSCAVAPSTPWRSLPMGVTWQVRAAAP